MTITEHILTEPWSLTSPTNALGCPDPVMERKLLLDVLTLGYQGMLKGHKIREFSLNYSNYGDFQQIWDRFIKATFSHHAACGLEQFSGIFSFWVFLWGDYSVDSNSNIHSAHNYNVTSINFAFRQTKWANTQNPQCLMQANTTFPSCSFILWSFSCLQVHLDLLTRIILSFQQELPGPNLSIRSFQVSNDFLESQTSLGWKEP